MKAAKPKFSYERLRDKTITYLRERGDCMWLDLKPGTMLVLKRAKYTTTETIHEPQSFNPYVRVEELVSPRLFMLIFAPGKPDLDREGLMGGMGVQVLRPAKLEDVVAALG